MPGDSVGVGRGLPARLSNFDVRLHATPLLAQSRDEPSAYEVLAAAAPGGEVTVNPSDRAEASPERR